MRIWPAIDAFMGPGSTLFLLQTPKMYKNTSKFTGSPGNLKTAEITHGCIPVHIETPPLPVRAEVVPVSSVEKEEVDRNDPISR